MKIRTPIIVITGLLTLLLLASCGRGGNEPEAVDVEATVSAAMAATATAESALEEQINTAVNDAVDAAVEEAVSEAVDAAVAEALANATPAPEYTSYTEEELILLIEETTQEAEAATYTYTEAASTATNDGEVTTEEAETIEYYVTISEEALAEVEAMIQTYYALYGGTGDEIVAELVAIESELNELNQSINEMVIILDEINTTLANGYELAEETIAQLEQAAAEAQTAVSEAAVQMQAWATKAQANATLVRENVTALQSDLTSILESVAPVNVAASQDEAWAQVADYINTASAALADNAISPEEMQAIAQMGSNAAASLAAQGGAGSNLLVNNINSLSLKMAQGDIQGAVAGLRDLQRQLPDLPGRTVPVPGGLPSPGVRP